MVHPSDSGNVVRGWEWSGRGLASKASNTKKINFHDRIFSLSSETSDVQQKMQNDPGMSISIDGINQDPFKSGFAKRKPNRTGKNYPLRNKHEDPDARGKFEGYDGSDSESNRDPRSKSSQKKKSKGKMKGTKRG